MERFKFLSHDKVSIFKFEGFGQFGDEVFSRALRLAQAGFAPAAEPAGDGMIRYSVVRSQPLTPHAVSRDLLDFIARYSAFRKREFSLPREATRLDEMLRFNLAQAFGTEVSLDSELLAATNPVLVDGRMQPHEWIRNGHGHLIKVDGCTHGDDHFFPGPTDIAWDLAGAIVEWNLDAGASDFLLSRFHQLSGDNPRPRIAVFTLAYAVFRLAYCKMASTTAVSTTDNALLQRAISRYRALARRQLASFRAGLSPRPTAAPGFRDSSNAAD
jgi:hypothetical protein